MTAGTLHIDQTSELIQTNLSEGIINHHNKKLLLTQFWYALHLNGEVMLVQVSSAQVQVSCSVHSAMQCRQHTCLTALQHTLLAEHLIVTAGALQVRGGYPKTATL